MKKFLFVVFAAPLITLAQGREYGLLAPLPGVGIVGQPGTSTAATYIPGIIRVVIMIAGALAVIQIIIAGIQYMSTDAMSGKSSARETINNAVIGLLLAIGAYTILNTINPALVRLNLNIARQTILGGGGFDGGDASLNCTAAAPCLWGEVVNCGPNIATCSDQNVQACSETNPCTTGKRICANCTIISSSDTRIPHKTVSENGCAQPGPCMMNEGLLQTLITINAGGQGGTWRVTEMFPPAIAHIDECHLKGTCVDIALTNPTVSNIATLLNRVELVRVNNPGRITTYTYEICPQADLNTFKATYANDPRLKNLITAGRFNCYGSTAGQNLHLEGPNN